MRSLRAAAVIWVFVVALAQLGTAQTLGCRRDFTAVTGTCQRCPTGFSRPLTIPETSPCIVDVTACYNTAPRTLLVCERNTRTCRVPCGQTLNCTQTILSCPAGQALNATRLCSAGSGSFNPLLSIQCTSSFCCAFPNTCLPTTNGASCLQPNGTAGVCLSSQCVPPSAANVACNSTAAGNLVCQAGFAFIPGSSCRLGSNCTSTACCQSVCIGRPIGSSCDDGSRYTWQDRCNSQGQCEGIETTCTDGVQNGDETGVDCGGSCPRCPTCSDGVRNGFESGIDCGGPQCVSCNATCLTAGVTCSILPNTTLLSSRFCVRNVNCTVAQCCVDQCFGRANGTNCTAAGNIPGRCNNSVCVSTLTTCSSQPIACPSGYNNGTITCIPGQTCNVATCCIARVSVATTSNNPASPCTVQPNGQCLCSSGLHGATCTTRVLGCDMTQQPLFVNTSSLAAVADAVLDNDNVTITVALEMVENREYLSVRLGSCTIRNFTLALLTTDATLCRDVWSITLPVLLLPLCGFSAVDTQQASSLDTLAGAVNIQYQDRISFNGVTRPRVTMATIPWRLNLHDHYNAPLAIGGLRVHAPVALTAAITSSRILAAASSALLTISCNIQFPYQIQSLNTIAQIFSTNGPTARVINSTNNQHFNSTQMTPPGCTNYTQLANQSASICRQLISLEILFNGQCEIQAAYAITNITFSCAPGVEETDCPITGPSAVASVSFSVLSDNICPDNAVSQYISETVTVVRFFAPATTSLLRNDSIPAVSRRAFTVNDTLVLRADFAGLAVFSMQLNAVSTSYLGGPMTLRYNANPLDMVPQIPSTMIAGNVNGVSLGFDQLRQSFLMAHPMNAAFGITGNGPVRGAAATLAIQATVDMSYSPDVLAGRRRRRHAGGLARASPSGPRRPPLHTLITTVSLIPVLPLSQERAVPQGVPATDTDPDETKRLPIHAIVGIAVGLMLVALVAMAAIWARCYHRRLKRDKLSKDPRKHLDVDSADIANPLSITAGMDEGAMTSPPKIPMVLFKVDQKHAEFEFSKFDAKKIITEPIPALSCERTSSVTSGRVKAARNDVSRGKAAIENQTNSLARMAARQRPSNPYSRADSYMSGMSACRADSNMSACRADSNMSALGPGVVNLTASDDAMVLGIEAPPCPKVLTSKTTNQELGQPINIQWNTDVIIFTGDEASHHQ